MGLKADSFECDVTRLIRGLWLYFRNQIVQKEPFRRFLHFFHPHFIRESECHISLAWNHKKILALEIKCTRLGAMVVNVMKEVYESLHLWISWWLAPLAMGIANYLWSIDILHADLVIINWNMGYENVFGACVNEDNLSWMRSRLIEFQEQMQQCKVMSTIT